MWGKSSNSKEHIKWDVCERTVFCFSYQPYLFGIQPDLFTFPYRTNGNHVKDLSTVGHVISERHWKITFDFIKIVSNYGSKQETVCQTVRFISHFSLKPYIQYWKYFHYMVLESVDRHYNKKIGWLDFSARLPQRA